MTQKIISFRGKLHSGKTTAAKYIVSKYPDHFERMAFADALKVEVYDLIDSGNSEVFRQAENAFGFGVMCRILEPTLPPDRFEDERMKIAWVDKNKSILRPFLQWYGTEYRRGQDDSYWIARLVERIEAARGNGKVPVIDDCRFENELAALRQRGCLDIWIENPEMKDPEGIQGHASEAMGPEGSDIRVLNKPSLGIEMFYRTLDRFIEDL